MVVNDDANWQPNVEDLFLALNIAPIPARASARVSVGMITVQLSLWAMRTQDRAVVQSTEAAPSKLRRSLSELNELALRLELQLFQQKANTC